MIVEGDGFRGASPQLFSESLLVESQKIGLKDIEVLIKEILFLHFYFPMVGYA